MIIANEKIDFRVHSILRRAEADISEIMQVAIRVRIITEASKIMTIENIADVVSEETGIALHRIKSKSHKQELVTVRDLLIGTLKKYLPKLTETFIGEWMGGRHPSTINFAVDRHEERMNAKDQTYKTIFLRIDNRVQVMEEELQLIRDDEKN